MPGSVTVGIGNLRRRLRLTEARVVIVGETAAGPGRLDLADHILGPVGILGGPEVLAHDFRVGVGHDHTLVRRIGIDHHEVVGLVEAHGGQKALRDALSLVHRHLAGPGLLRDGLHHRGCGFDLSADHFTAIMHHRAVKRVNLHTGDKKQGCQRSADEREHFLFDGHGTCKPQGERIFCIDEPEFLKSG